MKHCEKVSQPDSKPNSVRLRSPALRQRELRRDDHSSSPAIAGGIKRPTRKLRTGRPSGRLRALRRFGELTLPYLVLLRAGFCLPSTLRQTRCALTAPFHPYPSTRALSRARSGRCIFCATFLRVAPTGRYPAHCPAEFGLSSRLRAPRFGGQARFGTARRPAIVWRHCSNLIIPDGVQACSYSASWSWDMLRIDAHSRIRIRTRRA